jgi:hypothetical protein
VPHDPCNDRESSQRDERCIQVTPVEIGVRQSVPSEIDISNTMRRSARRKENVTDLDVDLPVGRSLCRVPFHDIVVVR